MSAQGIIFTLLSAIGTLVVGWVILASMWIKDRFTDHQARLDYHDDRILELEQRNELADDQREEMLTILRDLPRKSSNVG